MGVEKQGAKPSGFVGIIFGRLMNRFHTSLYINYLKNNLPADNSIIVDIGCGGGQFLKYLSQRNKTYKLYGLDHSVEMVSLSKKTNKEALEQHRLEIFQGSVLSLPFENTFTDLVTAFETVQFWPDIDTSFLEIARVLKDDRHFIIINRYPPEGSKWWKIAKIKSDKEYIQKLKNAGFKKVTSDLNFKKGWIIVEAIK